ncbi:MAG: hypothetical protein AAFP76_04450 [Bacteroidota bacterium]
MMHFAAQYLAAVGISFLEKKEDDSHTNLGLNVEEGRLETHLLSDMGDTLSLDYQNFSLVWSSFDGSASLRLEGTSHEEVLAWINKVSQKVPGKEYQFQLHYELPYEMGKRFRFGPVDGTELERLLQIRVLAQFALERALKDHSMTSSIRIWPHHFDTGSLSSLSPDSDVSIGMGLAIPDPIKDQHYFYVGGYRGHTPVNVSQFDPLTQGEWISEGFMGAVLPANNLDETEAVRFLNEAITAYKSL